MDWLKPNAWKAPFRWETLDGGFAPRIRRGVVMVERSQVSPGEELPEGHAALHHMNGWTVISFWDRSVDDRGASCSSFVVEGELPWAEAWEAAKTTFPTVVARYKFEVQHVFTRVWTVEEMARLR